MTAQLHGSRQRSVVPFPSPAIVVAPTPAPPVDVPGGLSVKAAAVWSREAPFAIEARTLMPATAEAFALFCRAVVLELKLSKGKTAGGASHRGMIAAVTAGRLRFGLSPNGKPVAAPAKDVDPFEQFDQVAR